jgi:hypothetical protein
LRAAEPPVIPLHRLKPFITDVFHDIGQIVHYHRILLDVLQHEQQTHEHIHSVSVAVFDAFLHLRDAYLVYIPHYPIAAYCLEDEMASNSLFKVFYNVRVTIFITTVI